MSEEYEDEEMPTGTSGEEMPTGEMGGEAPRGEMPTGAMEEASSGDEMPRGVMSEPSTREQMSGGEMAGAGAEPERFGPPNLPPGQTPAPTWESGVVEVEFRGDVRPEMVAPAAGAPAQIRSAEGVKLNKLNKLLQQHGLQSAESSFQLAPGQAEEAKATALSEGVDVPSYDNFVTLHFPPEADVKTIAEELNKLPEVERAVPIPKALPPQTPLNEPLVGTSDQVVLNQSTGLENQWYIFRCQANQAWSMASGNNVVVADIDWGYLTTHQDLASRLDLTHAYNSYDGGTNVSTGGSASHGTAVMGIAGGADNNLGMAGFAYQASLWPIQADSGPGAPLGGNSWARGIEWVRTANSGGRRKVIILEVQTGSFGNYEMVPSVNAAIKTAIASGVVVCVAAGNGNRDAGIDDSGNPIPPTGSILVGATAYHATQNQRAGFSNYGSQVVVSAPGDGSHDLTCGQASNTAYRNGFGGTSGATPKVAGTVALMLSVNPNLTHAQIRTILKDTGTPVVTDANKPVGTFLNSAAAVRAARGSAGGRLEVFVRGSDRALWHKWQTAPNNGWSGWQSLGGWIDRLEMGQNADGRLEAFVRGSNGALYHKWQLSPGGGWSNWESLGGWIDMLAVGRNKDGRLEVFARGANGALWHIWQVAPNSGWSGWQSLGGWIDRLAVGSNKDGRLEVFARGANGALFHMWQTAPNNGWSGWASLGGWIDLLAVGQNADGRLEVFASGGNSGLWHIWQTAPNNGWSGWQ
ncbi:MAG TPA: S8 family serine peptidase, partial [Pyrinomonadaceae bacterium]|nr:S8 family serine peptidase [Pyrinomonadaceae bacterium]